MSSRRLSVLLVASAIALGLPNLASAQTGASTDTQAATILPPTPDLAAFCAAYTGVSVPSVDQFQGASKASPDKSCDNLRPGLLAIDGKSYSHLRECAFEQGDTLTLATLYAEGLGVKENRAIARRFACETTARDGLSRPAVLTPGSLGRGSPFEACDEAGTAYDMKDCATLAVNVASVKLLKRLEHISARWPEEKRVALSAVSRAKNQYVEKKSERHEDEFRNGTMSGVGLAYDTSNIDTGFVALVEHLEKNKMRKVSSSNEEALRWQLTKQIRTFSTEDDFFVVRSDVLAVQKKYLRYREEWVKFAKRYYPAVSSDSVRAILDQARLVDLKELSSN